MVAGAGVGGVGWEWGGGAGSDGSLAVLIDSKQAREVDISIKTLKRAKKEMGIRSPRTGFGKGSEVFWKLPDIEGQPPTPAS